MKLKNINYIKMSNKTNGFFFTNVRTELELWRQKCYIWPGYQQFWAVFTYGVDFKPQDFLVQEDRMLLSAIRLSRTISTIWQIVTVILTWHPVPWILPNRNTFELLCDYVIRSTHQMTPLCGVLLLTTWIIWLYATVFLNLNFR